eukprot:TRINITY_DN112177_c0_g1_i1.p1 TRINITY_DN112177_c0_g1~~TRINITY_DN112177_c0_g1_i1.p1  ORF type:complete len:336 (-),score=44.00 TRINITY_DN112177_c0_g1_i1:387-1394(-)
MTDVAREREAQPLSTLEPTDERTSDDTIADEAESSSCAPMGHGGDQPFEDMRIALETLSQSDPAEVKEPTLLQRPLFCRSSSSKGSDVTDITPREAPQCPICMLFLCDPVTIACGHSFCRVCLLKNTRLSPTGRSCPMCRSSVNMKIPLWKKTNSELEDRVRQNVPESEYDAALEASKDEIARLQKAAAAKLPVFFVWPGSLVGAPVALHFFEARYKVLVQRAWEGERLFIFCAGKPRTGGAGVVVKMESVTFLADGSANMKGRAMQAVSLQDVWVEEDTGGLMYAKVDMLFLNKARDELVLDNSNSVDADNGASAVTSEQRLPDTNPGCSCAIM